MHKVRSPERGVVCEGLGSLALKILSMQVPANKA